MEWLTEFFAEGDLWLIIFCLFMVILLFVVVFSAFIAVFGVPKHFIRAVALLIATVSIVFFAFEKREGLVQERLDRIEEDYQEPKTTHLNSVISERSSLCRQITLEILRDVSAEEYGLQSYKCFIHDAYADDVKKVTVKMTKFHVSSILSNYLDETVSEYIDQQKVREFISDHSTHHQKYVDLVESNKDNRDVSRFLLVFIVLFVAGTALEIANELRDVVRRHFLAVGNDN